MRMIPAFVGAICCIALGMIAGKRIRDRENCLSEWEKALMHMEGALQTGGMAVPELMAAGNMPFLVRAAEQLKKNPSMTAGQLFALLPADVPLTHPERDVISALFAGIFAPDRERQLQSVLYARQQMARYAGIYREGAEKNIRLYQSLGWLSGAAAFILMC